MAQIALNKQRRTTKKRFCLKPEQLKTEFTIKNKILATNFRQLSPVEYYSGLFGDDYDLRRPFCFTSAGAGERIRFMTINEALENHSMADDITYYPCRFVDKARPKVKASRYAYALVVDLDYLFTQDLYKLIAREFYGYRPTYIVNSGKGLHLVYAFTQTQPVCLGRLYPWISNVQRALLAKFSKKDMSYDVDMSATPVHAYRLVGSRTKLGQICTAFEVGEPYTWPEFLRLVKPEKKTIYELPKAKKGTLANKKGFFTAVYNRLMTDELQEGHYETGLFALYVIAFKCGVPKAVAEKAVERIGARHRMKPKTMEKAKTGYCEDYIRAYATTLEKWLGFEFRRGRKYERTMEQYQREKKEATADKIKDYIKEHPTANNTEIAKELGISRRTVIRHKKDILGGV